LAIYALAAIALLASLVVTAMVFGMGIKP